MDGPEALEEVEKPTPEGLLGFGAVVSIPNIPVLMVVFRNWD